MRSEDSLQIRTVKWLKTALPADVCWFGIEHAQRLTMRQGAVRKAKGVRRGLPDLYFLHGGRSIAVELKTETGRQSDEQKEFQARFTVAGGIYAVCRSEQDVELVLRAADVPVRIPAPAPWVSLPSDKAPRTRSTVPMRERPDAARLRAVARARKNGVLV